MDNEDDSARAVSTDFFDTSAGTAIPLRRRRLPICAVLDVLGNLSLCLSLRRSRLRRQAAGARQRVLIVGIEVPDRSRDIHRVVAALRHSSPHDISVSIAAMGDRGKFGNINAAIYAASAPLQTFDWLVVTDDDISFADGFLDDLIAFATAGEIAIAQPAHAFLSHTTYSITRRRLGSLLRQTTFVEIGPLTLVHRSAFDVLLPFPETRWCYGIDLIWADVAERHGLRMGIVDGTPVRHLRPVGASYSMDDAIEEARTLMRDHRVTRTRAQLFAKNDVMLGWL